MSPATTAGRIVEMMARRGRPMTLRRRTGTTGSFTDVTVTGDPTGNAENELIGEISQGDRVVAISNKEIAAASWPGPPRKGDLVVIDGVTTTVQQHVAMYDGLSLLGHVLLVRG